jgi:hypothetical protein
LIFAAIRVLLYQSFGRIRRAKKQTPPIIKALTNTAVSMVTESIISPLALLCILTARVQGSTKAEAASKQGWPLSYREFYSTR